MAWDRFGFEDEFEFGFEFGEDEREAFARGLAEAYERGVEWAQVAIDCGLGAVVLPDYRAAWRDLGGDCGGVSSAEIRAWQMGARRVLLRYVAENELHADRALDVLGALEG
jgi:hypothetical protein